VPIPPEILRAVNRSSVYGQVSRWLIHDLRNPSQALTLITELMQYDPDSEDDPPENTIREATGHLVRSLELLDRVLRIPARIAEPRPVSLGDHLEFLDALHHVHRIPVMLNLSGALLPSLPAVSAVEDHLEHALLNLLVNATEACEGRPEARIDVSTTVGDGRVILEFKDNGRGIAPALCDRLFQPFITTRTDRPFAGLGLAVARDLLARAGGTLEFDSERPDGACFVVTLRTWR
jgi:signal transduction histidine kinase